MKKFIFAIIFCVCFFNLSAHKYQLTVCAIYNEDDLSYMPEWIDFHLKQGIEHFYLYDNSVSGDNKNLSPYIVSEQVEIKNWPSTNIWNDTQVTAYRDCAQIHKEDTQWIAFIDTDEFLFSANTKSLIKNLQNYEEHLGVGVNWVNYGTSGIAYIPADKRMIDLLTYRSKIKNEMNLYVKCIVQPAKLLGVYTPHDYIGNKCEIVDENYHEVKLQKTKKCSVKKFRINHYWSRDLQFFENVKLKKRTWQKNIENMRKLEQEYNAVFDPILSS